MRSRSSEEQLRGGRVVVVDGMMISRRAINQSSSRGGDQGLELLRLGASPSLLARVQARDVALVCAPQHTRLRRIPHFTFLALVEVGRVIMLLAAA